MESRPAPSAAAPRPQVHVLAPDGTRVAAVELAGDRVSVGRLAEVNDIALEPDPQLLVTRVAHCAFEREGNRWVVVDGESVNGTFLRRDGELEQVAGRAPLQNGDVVCVLAEIDDAGNRRFFELAFETVGDSQATRAAIPRTQSEPAPEPSCLHYDPSQARLLLVRGDETHEVGIRAQGHRLVRYMAERNAAAGGTPVLCTHDELMQAVWGDEPMHTRAELAKLVWELRKKLEPFAAGDLIESERRRGYRMRTCAAPG